MPINFQTFKEIINATRADLRKELPTIDPTIFGSWGRAFADSLSGRVFDIVQLVKQLVIQMFPETAISTFLEGWGAYEGLTKNPATKASGQVTFTGTIASVIPINTALQTNDSIQYITKSQLTLANQSQSVSLVRAGSIVTGTSGTDHLLGSGQSATISGADQAEYNGTFTMTVLSATTFSYVITGTPATPATGTIIGSFDGGFVEVESVDEGENKNQDPGAQLSLVSPISGVDTIAWVQFSELAGGTDEEEDGATGTGIPGTFRFRIYQSRRNPVANFNPTSIEKVALAVAGVTRVLVKRITPIVGAVTILFVRDGDDNIIPSPGEVQDVEDAILLDLPAPSDEADVHVTAPTAITTNYTFSSITPDTSTMRTAIINNLIAFYRDGVDFETNITEDKYRAAIINTIDPETGDTLTAFTLTTPTTDIAVTTDQIGVLGTVTF